MNGPASGRVYKGMSDCQEIRPLLSAGVGGDLDAGDAGRMASHLSGCRVCKEEAGALAALVSQARVLLRSEDRMPPAVLDRIALEAAGRARRRSWDLTLFPTGAWSRRTGLLASAAAVLVALVAMPVALRPGRGPASGRSEVSTIEVVADGGSVRLAWSDGNKASYTVYKSDDPRGLARAEVHVVRGNFWVDPDPDSSPVVFYRIE